MLLTALADREPRAESRELEAFDEGHSTGYHGLFVPIPSSPVSLTRFQVRSTKYASPLVDY